MAHWAVKGLEAYADKLSALNRIAQREVAGHAIYEGAKIVADQAKANLAGVIRGPSTGALIGSLGISTMQESGDGWNVKLGFDGYDAKGVPNQLKARVMESGSSKQAKRPFFRPAINATKGAAVEKMGQIIDEEIAQIMG